jgi:biopolymer transport protein ExbD
MKPSLQERLEQDPQHAINLSPLIDVVFILLIFFIVTTVFIKETGVKVDKPVAVTAQKLENELILLAITPAGEVVYDHSNIGVSGVRSTVSALLMVQDRPVVIQADRTVTTDLLVRVMDEAKLGGAKSISIGTVEAR